MFQCSFVYYIGVYPTILRSFTVLTLQTPEAGRLSANRPFAIHYR